MKTEIFHSFGWFVVVTVGVALCWNKLERL